MAANQQDSKPLVLTKALMVLPEWYVELISQYFDVVTDEQFSENPERYRHDIRGILVFPLLNITTKHLLDQLPNLKIVGNAGVGVDHLDFNLFRSHRIRLASLGKGHVDCVADLGMALLLAVARRVTEGNDMCRRGIAAEDMTEVIYNYPLGVKVTGSTIGIIGMGSIGYRIAEIAARGFNMRVIYHNRSRRSSSDEEKVGATYCEQLDELLPEVDFLVLACPNTEATTGMIGRRQFSLMKNTAILINIGRGAIVDHDALAEAVKGGVIRGAGLDVTSPEPLPPDHDLLKLPTVIVTPHIGSATMTARYGMLDDVLTNMVAGIAGRPMPLEVDLNL